MAVVVVVVVVVVEEPGNLSMLLLSICQAEKERGVKS